MIPKDPKEFQALSNTPLSLIYPNKSRIHTRHFNLCYPLSTTESIFFNSPILFCLWPFIYHLHFSASSNSYSRASGDYPSHSLILDFFSYSMNDWGLKFGMDFKLEKLKHRVSIFLSFVGKWLPKKIPNCKMKKPQIHKTEEKILLSKQTQIAKFIENENSLF